MRISDWSSDVCSSDLEAVAPARPVLLGDSRPSPELHALEAYGLGGLRPECARGRGLRSRRSRRELEGGARRDPGRDPLKGLEPGEAVLRPALRRDGAGRFAASGAFDRLPAAGRSARYRHCRSDPARPGRRWPGPALPPRTGPGRAGGYGGHVPRLQLLAGRRPAHGGPGRGGEIPHRATTATPPRSRSLGNAPFGVTV